MSSFPTPRSSPSSAGITAVVFLKFIRDGELVQSIRTSPEGPRANCNLFARPDGNFVKACRHGVVQWLNSEGEKLREWRNPERELGGFRGQTAIGIDENDTMIMPAYPNTLWTVYGDGRQERSEFSEGDLYARPTRPTILGSGVTVIGNNAEMRAHNNYNVINFFRHDDNQFHEFDHKVIHIPGRMAQGFWSPVELPGNKFVISDRYSLRWVDATTLEVTDEVDVSCMPLPALKSGAFGCIRDRSIRWLRDGRLYSEHVPVDSFEWLGPVALTHEGSYVISLRLRLHYRPSVFKLIWLNKAGQKTFEYLLPEEESRITQLATLADGTLIYSTEAGHLRYMKVAR